MKTNATLQLEEAIKRKYCTAEQFGVHEVTLGIGGHERADFMTISVNDVVRCFEIKVSMSDLKSKAKLTFCGNFNYLAAPYEIASAALDMLPPHIGILYGESLEVLRSPSYCEVPPELLSTIKTSLIRSMAREMRKGDPTYFNNVARQLSHTRKSLADLRAKDEIRNRIADSLYSPDPDELEELEDIYEAVTGKPMYSYENVRPARNFL